MAASGFGDAKQMPDLARLQCGGLWHPVPLKKSVFGRNQREIFVTSFSGVTRLVSLRPRKSHAGYFVSSLTEL